MYGEGGGRPGFEESVGKETADLCSNRKGWFVLGGKQNAPVYDMLELKDPSACNVI